MPNSKSAAKRVRQDIQKKRANASRKTAIKTMLKKIEALDESSDPAKAEEQKNKAFKALDKAVKNNVIHKNNAARKKSQIAKKVHRLTAKG